MPAALGTFFVIASAIILLLTIATIFFGWRNGTVSLLLGMDDESWNRSNSRKDRHRIRRTSAIVLAAVIAIDLVVLYAGLTYHGTYGSNNYIENAMDEAGVCQHSYMNFRDDVHAFLGTQNLPQNSLDLALTYRNYRFDYVKGTRYAIKNGSEDVMYRGIQESVEAQIGLMAYITKKDSGKVEREVNEIYTKSLSTSVGMFINKLRTSLDGRYLAGYIMSILSLILAGVMIVFERHSIYRGVGNLATGALAGTALWGVATVAVAALYDASQIGLADDAVYVTNLASEAGITRMMLTLLVISAVTSVLLFVTSKIMQKRDYY